MTAVERLVVGDIVSVKFGDRLPADIRIITSAGFKVNFLVAIFCFCIGQSLGMLIDCH